MKAILTYHSIDETGSPVSVSAEQFENHRRWLTSRRVKALALDDLIAHPADGNDAVAVTFDDGFLNTRGAVESLLGDGVPVTLFVVSQHPGRTNAWGGREQAGIPTLPLLSWDDLERLQQRGASIEAHTRTHPRLTSLSDQALDDELQGAQAELLARLGASCNHLAYPYGDVDARVVDHTRRFYSFGHTTDFKVFEAENDPLGLPRLDMYYFRAGDTLGAWGSAGFRRRLAWWRARRTAGRLIALKGFRG